MKKILPLFFLCVALHAFAQEIDDPIIITAPDTTIDKTAYTLTDQGITISVSYGSAYPAEHQYNNIGVTYFACLVPSTMTITAPQAFKGIAINGWVKKNFSATSNKGTIEYIEDDEDDATGKPVLVITDIDSTSVTISCDKQLRCFSLEVYFNENPEPVLEPEPDTVRFTAVTAIAADYSNDTLYSYEGHYSYWLELAPADEYPAVYLALYSAVKGDLSGEYSPYNFNVDDWTYVQISEDEMDYEYAYDQEFTITKNGNDYHVEGWILCENEVVYQFTYDGPITIQADGDEEGIDTLSGDGAKVTKELRDGHLVITRGEKQYTIVGTAL